MILQTTDRKSRRMWAVSWDHYPISSFAVSNIHIYIHTSSRCKQLDILLLPRIRSLLHPWVLPVQRGCFMCDNILFGLKQVGKQVSCDNYFSRFCSVYFLLVRLFFSQMFQYWKHCHLDNFIWRYCVFYSCLYLLNCFFSPLLVS